MPSNWLYIDTNFPTFTGEEETEEKVSSIQNYLFMLVEQLRYSLRNLDLKNMNPAAVERFTGTITEPIYGRIEDAEGNIAQLGITAQGLAAKIGDAEGNIASLQVTAKQLASQISDANGNISQLQQTATSIQSTVANQAGQISQLQQTATSIQSTVTNQAGQISRLQQRADGFETVVADQNDNISEIRQSVDSISFSVNGSSLELTKDGVTVSETLQAAALIGNEIELRDNWDRTAATFKLTGSSSSLGQKIAIWSDAIQMSTWAGDIYLSAGSGGSLQVGDSEVQINGDLIPNRADHYNCGTYAFPWLDVYSTDGTISSSDLAGKKDIDYDMGKYSGLFDRLRPCSFLRVNGTSGRRHHGFIAQEVKAALQAEGMSGMDFAGYVEWDGGCGLRYEEIISMLVHEVQEIKKRLENAEVENGVPSEAQP